MAQHASFHQHVSYNLSTILHALTAGSTPLPRAKCSMQYHLSRLDRSRWRCLLSVYLALQTCRPVVRYVFSFGSCYSETVSAPYMVAAGLGVAPRLQLCKYCFTLYFATLRTRSRCDAMLLASPRQTLAQSISDPERRHRPALSTCRSIHGDYITSRTCHLWSEWTRLYCVLHVV